MEDPLIEIQAACDAAYGKSQVAYSSLRDATKRVAHLIRSDPAALSDGRLESARHDCMMAQVHFDQATNDYTEALSALNRARMGEAPAGGG
jgi:hypothetical protein